jgi:hypothetical protein
LTGDVGRLPLADGAVGYVLTVNTVYFWSDLGVAFREVHRILRRADGSKWPSET